MAAFTGRLRDFFLMPWLALKSWLSGSKNKRTKEVFLLYRTITPQQFEKKTSKPRPPAFHLRQEPSLSVWDAQYVKPRQLLQKYLDEVKVDLTSDDEAKQQKAQNRLKSNGSTPEEMYGKGWRIASLTSDVFTSLDLPVSPPRKDGHRDVTGTLQDFEDSADSLAESSQILTEQETLA